MRYPEADIILNIILEKSFLVIIFLPPKSHPYGFSKPENNSRAGQTTGVPVSSSGKILLIILRRLEFHGINPRFRPCSLMLWVTGIMNKTAGAQEFPE